MKKIIIALLASVCAFGSFAKELVVDNTRYVYEEIADGIVELKEINPKIEGSELDLGAVQKLFSEENLRITQLANLDEMVADKSAITNVVISEHMESRMNVSDLISALPNVESVFGGGSAITTIDGLAYAEGGRVLIRCPKAHADAVKLPSNCRQILPYAFAGCRNLTGVTGGAEVLRVGSCAFGDLYENGDVADFIANLPDGIVMVEHAVIGWKGDDVPATIELPVGATSVAALAFPESVTNVTGGQNVKWVGVAAFEGVIDASPFGEPVMVGDVLIGCNGNVPTLTPPANTVAIAPSAFMMYTAIEELDLAGLDKLEVIGDNAFYGCNGLERVILPDCVKEIQDCAFESCENLREFTFGSATEALGYGVFGSCGELKDVYFRCEKAPLEDVDISYDFQDAFYSETPDSLTTHVMPNSTGWNLDDNGKWCLRNFDRGLKRDAVAGYVGYYGKWALSKLGVAVPPAGTVYSAVAYGLPKGLVLKSNAAKKNKKGKVVTPAKTSWWIEGVPTDTLDGTNQTAFVKTVVNGFSDLQPLAFVVAETPVIDVDTNKYPLAANTPIVMPGSLPELGTGWTLSGLPSGLKQTKKAVKVKLAGKSRAVQAYGVYGTPTVPGNYVATAKKKSGSWNLVRKLRFQVRDENGELTEDPQDDRTPVELNFNGGDGAIRQFAQGGVRHQPQFQQQVGEEPVVYYFTAPEGATLSLSGAPATLSIVEDPDHPGDWYIVGSAPPGDYLLTVVASQEGSLDARQTLMIQFNALPAWSTGSFAGYVTDPEIFSYPFGYCTVTVGAKGAISGKFAMNDSTYTFSTDSYTANNGESLTADGIPLKVYETRSVYDKKKKKNVNKQVLVASGLSLDIEVSSGVGGLLTGKVKDDETGDTVAKLHAQQNLWSTSYKSIGTSLFRASAKQQYRTYKQTFEGGATLAFKITPLGKVTVTGSIPYRKKVKKNGRWVYVTAYTKQVASTVLMPETDPEAGAAGFKGRVAICLGDEFRDLLGRDVRFDGGFVDFPFPVEASSWSTGEFNGVAYVRLPNRFYDKGQTEQEWDCMYGTYNIKVKSSLAFTGTFTPAVGEAKTFSGTFKQQAAAGAADVYYYEATSSLLWDGWMIPFKLTLDEGAGGTGSISFEPTESGAAFCSYNGLGLPALPIGQDLFLRSDMDMHISKDPGTVWADMQNCQMGNDMLTYRFSSNGRVSISGMVDGYEVKTSAVIQFAPQDDLSTGPYTGCFYFCLDGYGLFVQPCTFGEKVSVENHQQLQPVWTLDN